MRCEIPQPCIGCSASVLRISRSSVPCRTSDWGAEGIREPGDGRFFLSKVEGKDRPSSCRMSRGGRWRSQNADRGRGRTTDPHLPKTRSCDLRAGEGLAEEWGDQHHPVRHILALRRLSFLRASQMTRRILILLVVLVAQAVSAAAQGAPARPRLPGGADPNDWEAYYDYGVRMLNGNMVSAAAGAFYWAARLDPSRAEPLYASRVTIFRDDIGRWERYLRDDPQTLKRPEMERADSLMGEAWLRNPFVPTSLNLLLYNQLPGDWGRD